MKKRIRICLMLSVALIIVGILVGLLAGFRFGTEYRAGERMVIDFAEDFSSAKVDAAVKRAGVEASPVEKITKNKIYQGVISIKYQDDMESARNRVMKSLWITRLLAITAIASKAPHIHTRICCPWFTPC